MYDPSPSERMACEIPCGHAVNRPGNMDPGNIYMKVERKGADYIHHYLVQMSPLKSISLAIIYIDPEVTLIDKGVIPTFELLSSEAHQKPQIGHIFESHNGTFLKVAEDPKSLKMYAFINIASGEVKRRQERNINTVYDTWQITKIAQKSRLA
jgi:hypothetical protein